MTKRGDAQRQYELIREYHLLKKAAKPPLEPFEPFEARSLKAGMSGFEWLVTTYHLRASPFIKIDAERWIGYFHKSPT